MKPRLAAFSGGRHVKLPQIATVARDTWARSARRSSIARLGMPRSAPRAPAAAAAPHPPRSRITGRDTVRKNVAPVAAPTGNQRRGRSAVAGRRAGRGATPSCEPGRSGAYEATRRRLSHPEHASNRVITSGGPTKSSAYRAALRTICSFLATHCTHMAPPRSVSRAAIRRAFNVMRFSPAGPMPRSTAEVKVSRHSVRRKR